MEAEVDYSSRNLSNIRNKKRRQELFKQLKHQKSKAKSKLKKAKKKLIKEQGMLIFNSSLRVGLLYFKC